MVRLLRILLPSLVVSLLAQQSMAKIAMNAMCTLEDTKDSVVEPFKLKKGEPKVSPGHNLSAVDVERPFTIASISKMMTTHWAVTKLGANYRFKTGIWIFKSDPKSKIADRIHFQGGRDPIFGREAGYYLISSLIASGIVGTKQITFDENFYINWLILQPKRGLGTDSLYQVAGQDSYFRFRTENIASSLRLDFGTPVSKAVYSRIDSMTAAPMVDSPNWKGLVAGGTVEPVKKEDFDKESNQDATILVLESPELHSILKEMNNHSHNYIADALFYKLGGPTEYATFIEQDMGLTTNNIRFFNGSGYPHIDEQGRKVYNQASCSAIVKILQKTQHQLTAQGSSIDHVAAVANEEFVSTLGSRYSFGADSIVAKTGTVNTAITLAGSIKTETGDVFFATLVKTDGKADALAARNYISKNTQILVNRYSLTKISSTEGGYVKSRLDVIGSYQISAEKPQAPQTIEVSKP